MFNQWEEQHILTEVEAFMGWCVHTSAFFVRKIKKYLQNRDYDDIILVTTWQFAQGKLHKIRWRFEREQEGASCPVEFFRM